jgi:hypothetical protein
MIVAAGMPPTVTVGADVATRLAGAAPKVHAIIAPDTTCCPIPASLRPRPEFTVLTVPFLANLQVSVDAYQRDGFVVIRRAVDVGTVDACINHLKKLQATPAFSGNRLVAPSLSTDGFLRDLTGDARLTSVAASLLGSEVVPFGCTYMVKEARCGPPALWHQDGHPWQTVLGITAAVTMWIALDPVDGDNGGLEVIPGTHRLEAEPLRRVADPPNLFGWGLDPAGIETSRSVPLSLAPGDLSAHHPNLIHCSSPNRGERHRRALVIRYRSGRAGS